MRALLLVFFVSLGVLERSGDWVCRDCEAGLKLGRCNIGVFVCGGGGCGIGMFVPLGREGNECQK